MAPPRTLADFLVSLPQERQAEYRRVLKERLNITPEDDGAPFIDSGQVATLAGVQPGTVTQWKMRTRLKRTLYPFPQPAPQSYAGKPLYGWREICAWLDWARKWPPLSAAREQTRGPRTAHDLAYTYGDLQRMGHELAAQLEEHGLHRHEEARTVRRWRELIATPAGRENITA